MPYQGRLPYTYKSPYNYTLDQGTQTVPSLAFLGDTNNGLFSPATDVVAITTNGSEKLRVTSDGRVGIGTDNPFTDYKVHVTGTVGIGSGGFSQQLALGNNGIQSLLLGTGYTNLTLNALGGNVGIGTTNPAYPLDIAGTNASMRLNSTSTSTLIITSGASNAARIEFGDLANNDTGYIYYDNSNDSMQFATNGSNERLRITSTGNVGIGTDNPAHLLHLHGSSPIIQFEDSDNADNIYSLINASGSNGRLLFQIDPTDLGPDSHVRFDVDGSERLRITSTGNVGIGTTSPAAKLQVVGSIYASNGGTIRTYRSDDARYGSIYTNNNGTYIESSSSGDNMYVRSVYNNVNIVTGSTTKLTVSNDGNVGIGTDAPQSKLEIVETRNQLSLRCDAGAGVSAYTAQGRTLQFSCGQINTSPFTTFSDIVANSSAFNENVLRFFTNSSSGGAPQEKLRIDGDGNVGIGTTDPGAKLDVNGNVFPTTDATHDLGSTTKRWANIYSADLQLSNEGSQNDVDGTWGQYTIQEGETDLFLINRRNGKKYKFVLQEVN